MDQYASANAPGFAWTKEAQVDGQPDWAYVAPALRMFSASMTTCGWKRRAQDSLLSAKCDVKDDDMVVEVGSTRRDGQVRAGLAPVVNVGGAGIRVLE